MFSLRALATRTMFTASSLTSQTGPVETAIRSKVCLYVRGKPWSNVDIVFLALNYFGACLPYCIVLLLYSESLKCFSLRFPADQQ